VNTEAASLYRQKFDRDGFVVVPQFATREYCAQVRSLVEKSLDPLLGPAEFEADVGYPGAPETRYATGGNTPRRLLNAYARYQPLQQHATGERLAGFLGDLFGRKDVLMSQNHHNCVMTKHPGYSTGTAWHQDIRYWSFDLPELISAWLALDHETARNGALSVIPGSHRLDLDRGRFDRDLFLRKDLDENQDLIKQALIVELQPGDLLLFHCRLFHAAGRNMSDKIKVAAVFTYHTADNRPIPGTRSAHYPGIDLDWGSSA
jgi:phytanoyl-CoA hydroxylase